MNIKRSLLCFSAGLAIATASYAQWALPSNDPIPQSTLITPEQVNQMLTSSHKPLILNIGPRSMYMQAHIPGSEYMGAGSSDAGQQKLRERVKPLPKNAGIVLYCGCCPWSHCPNVHPAYQLLHSMGYTNVRVVYIANDFGTDWVNKGYAVARGD
ncbi:MAG TPA: rhodanese-like domain-containing protein [Terriglobales bacterium]|nr:rhodanese-like domain-containing protein [Terriglobales bacterium]